MLFRRRMFDDDARVISAQRLDYYSYTRKKVYCTDGETVKNEDNHITFRNIFFSFLVLLNDEKGIVIIKEMFYQIEQIIISTLKCFIIKQSS